MIHITLPHTPTTTTIKIPIKNQNSINSHKYLPLYQNYPQTKHHPRTKET